MEATIAPRPPFSWSDNGGDVFPKTVRDDEAMGLEIFGGGGGTVAGNAADGSTGWGRISSPLLAESTDVGSTANHKLKRRHK